MAAEIEPADDVPNGADAALVINIIDESVATMQRHLEEKRQLRQGNRATTNWSSTCIYKVPPSVTGISPTAIEPEKVSIGPYHHGKPNLSEFERYKWWFLDDLLSRKQHNLTRYIELASRLEIETRSFYSDQELLSHVGDKEFIQMMVLDGCFIIELFRHVCKSSDNDVITAKVDTKDVVGAKVDKIDGNDGSILGRPWLIPILCRDLIKLENQLPFFVLKKLYEMSMDEGDGSLVLLALKFFNNSLRRPFELLKTSSSTGNLEGKHLLDLLCLSFLPTEGTSSASSQKYRPSSQPIQCVTQLRSSGIELKKQSADSFLEIKFKNGKLKIPPITINNFTTTFFINCIALEQCRRYTSTWFTTYITFMSCLINSTRDVTFLCSDGIISTGFSHNDQQNVAELFRKLGEKAGFNISDCYLSKQFSDVEAYYSSHRGTFVRTHFSKPWSFISFVTFLILLFLTAGQTAFAVLSYINEGSPGNKGN